MSASNIIYTDSFASTYREITSTSTKKRVRRAIESIATFPDMESAIPTKSLVQRYGKDIRTLPAGSYVIVYEHRNTALILVALAPAKLMV